MATELPHSLTQSHPDLLREPTSPFQLHEEPAHFFICLRSSFLTPSLEINLSRPHTASLLTILPGPLSIFLPNTFTFQRSHSRNLRQCAPSSPHKMAWLLVCAREALSVASTTSQALPHDQPDEFRLLQNSPLTAPGVQCVSSAQLPNS